ncbi:MAG: calcium/sodium antiporter [Cognatishimia sp.]|uniref:calcium/sodium antiporter n=1 Tax=Cognatishimia sp. TaxID=2211648 RepID=UPI003B8DD38F
MIYELFLTCVGLAVLIYSADTLVETSETIAKHFGISAMILGLTVVAFGTSLPELVVSLQSAILDREGLAIGNVVGSNIANTLLVLGVAAALRPIPLKQSVLKRDGAVWILSSILFLVACGLGMIPRLMGIFMVIALLVYVWTSFKADRAGDDAEDEEDEDQDNEFGIKSVVFIIGCLVGVAAGSHLTVTHAVNVATLAGIHESIIGITLIAIGTSLPELTTTIACVRRGQTDMLVGNIIGSNIFNILAVLGVTATFIPLTIPERMLGIDLLAFSVATLAGYFFLLTDLKMTRKEGAVSILMYCSYISILVYIL